jgi:Protein of unknown function (DUF1153)
MFELNLAECGRGVVIDTADSAAIETTGPELFTLCTNTKTRPRPPTACDCFGHWGAAIRGPMDFCAVADPSCPRPELPPPDVKRWTFRRKAAVVTAVAKGVLTREEACRRYQLSEEEFLSWQQAFEVHGLPGLRSTRLQQYRGAGPRRSDKSGR